MRKWTMAALAAGGLLAAMSPDTASAQRSVRGANRAGDFDYNQDYEEGAGRGQRGGQAFGQPGQAQPRRGNAAAGQQGQRYVSRRVGNETNNRQASQLDRELASWLTVDNRGEIALAQLAKEQASNSDVREFAETMIDEHSQMVEQLQRFTGNSRGGARGRSRLQAEEQNPNDGRAMRPASGQLNIVRLKQQLGQQCVSSAKEELGQKEGDEFDKCYIGMQIAMHMQMLDTLKVFSHYASEELDQLIEEAEGTTEEHLDHAKQLIKQLEQGGQGHSASHSGARGSSESTTKSARRSASGRSSAARSGGRTSSDSDDDSDDNSDD
jgi:predicted outer membrane protein